MFLSILQIQWQNSADGSISDWQLGHPPSSFTPGSGFSQSPICVRLSTHGIYAKIMKAALGALIKTFFSQCSHADILDNKDVHVNIWSARISLVSVISLWCQRYPHKCPWQQGYPTGMDIHFMDIHKDSSGIPCLDYYTTRPARHTVRTVPVHYRDCIWGRLREERGGGWNHRTVTIRSKGISREACFFSPLGDRKINVSILLKKYTFILVYLLTSRWPRNKPIRYSKRTLGYGYDNYWGRIQV